MPQYRIQDSETGRTLLVEGDSPPTESEMAELFSQAAPASPKQSQGESGDMLLTDEGPAGGMPPEAAQEPQDNGKGRIRSAAAEVGRAAVEGFGLGFKGLGASLANMPRFPKSTIATLRAGTDPFSERARPEETVAWNLGEAITDAGNRAFQPNQKYHGEWLASKIPQGLGSTVAFLPAAVAGAPGIAAVGAMVNGAAAYDEAKQKGADDDQATRTFWWNALGGTSEAFPLSRIIDRINKASKGAVGKWVKDVIASGFEEGVQEGAQQALQNIVAKHIYEPERKVLEGVAEGAGVGAAVGLLLPGVGGGVKIAGQKAGEAVRQKYLRESTGMVPGGGTGGMIPVEPETPTTGGPGGTVVNFKTSDGSEGTLKLAPGTDPKVGVKTVKTQHKGATITGFEALPGPAAGITREQAEAGASQGVAPSRFSSPVDAAIMESAPTEARVTPSAREATLKTLGLPAADAGLLPEVPAKSGAEMTPGEFFDAATQPSSGALDIIQIAELASRSKEQDVTGSSVTQRTVPGASSIPSTRGAAIRKAHELQIKMALRNGSPVNANAVKKYGIQVPDGYAIQGDSYVKQSAPTEARVTPATAPEENLPPPGPPTSPVAVSAAEPESQAVTPTPPAPPVEPGVSTPEEVSQAEKGPSDASGVRAEAGLVPTQGVPVEGGEAQGGNQLEPGPPEQPQPVGAGEEAPVAKKKRGFALTQRQLLQRETDQHGYDIIAWVADQMPVMSKTSARKRGGDFWRLNKSMWDGSPKLANPRHNQVYARTGGAAPDRVAAAAYEFGILKSPDVDELWRAIEAASSGRAGSVKRASGEKSELDAMGEEFEAWKQATASGAFEASADDLNVGDVLDVEGEPVKVRAKDPATGAVELDDGKRFGRQTLKAGQTIWVEKATLADGTVVEPEAKPAEEPVPEPDQPATIEDKLRALKTDMRGKVFDVTAATYHSLKNAILDVAIGFIKVGKALDAAVRDAIAWGRVNFPKVKFDAVQMEKDIYDGLSKVQGFSTGGLRGVQRVVRALDKDPVTADKVGAEPFDPENVPTLMGKLSRPSAVTENFDRQLQTAKEAANTEDAYTKAAVLTMQAQLLRNMEESFYGKDPKLIPWWVKMFIPRQRLNEAHRAATHVAASLNVTQADMLNGYTFEPFEMRAGPVPASVIEKAGLQPGDTWQSQNWRGQKELLTIGPKVELEDGRTIYQLLRPMSVQTQKEVWQWFQQEYPEFEWLIDMWVNPALKGARETVNGVEVPIFNRWALMDRYGESDPNFVAREAYTPDVLVPALLSGATAKWLKERKWTFREGVRSPGRKYETGAARESGAVLDLISGWSVRAAQVLREESRKRWLNQVISAAVDVPNGNPAAIPKGWVKLENAIDDVWTAVQSMREWHGKGFPQVTATFADRNSPEFKAYFSELQKLHYLNRPKMLPKHVAESLIRDWEQQDNLGMMARTAKAIHQFITRDPALSEEWARKMRRGMEGWAMNYKAFLLLMPRTYLVNRTDNYLRLAYAAWQRMVYAAMRGGDREAFGEARHLLLASMVNLMPGVRQAFHLGENKLFNEAVTRSLVPQLFEQQTNLADLQVYGASVRDQVRSLYDQGLKKQAAALMAKNAGVLSLEATGYGNLDITAKQQMAFNLLLADAKQQANRLGLKGAARKEAIAAFVLHPPSEKLAAAIKYTNRALLNYSDTPQWINWAARHPAISTFVAFPIFRYHWLSREIDRATRGFKLEWDRLVKHKRISKEERANAWADFISWATMPAMGWGAANIAYALADSVLGLSAGADDDDDDPRKLVGSSTTIELDDDGKAARKSMARDLVTSNRINMNRVGRMFGLDTGGDEDWWLYIKGLPIIQSASLFHLAQSDARKFGFATGMKTALVGMRDLLSDMTGVGQAPKLGFKIAAELGNETDKPAYSWIDPYATSVPLSAYTTLLALQLIPGQRQADELLKWMDPTPRRITASKSLDYDPGVIEAIKQGGWTGIAHRIQRKISAGTFESDLPAKGHINRRLGEVDKPVTYGLGSRIASLAGFNVKPVNRQEYEEQLDE